MISILRAHAAALACALLLGGATFYFLHTGIEAIPGFSGIAKETVDDQTYYLARAKDVTDGHPLLANPYIAEHKDTFPMQFWLPDYALAKPLQLLSVPVVQGYLFYDFLLVAALFVLVYMVAVETTGSRALGLLGALFLNAGIFEYDLIRTPSPDLNFIFWLLTALFSLRYIRTRKRQDLVGATLSFGLLFYLYPYFWTYWAALLGVFVVLDFLWLKDRLYRPFFAMLVLGFVIGSQYFWSVWQSSHLPYYRETLERVGLIYSHFPSGLNVVFGGGLVLLVMVLAWHRRVIERDPRTLLMLSGVLAALIAINQHIVTGQNLEFSSHYYLPSIAWFTLAVLYSLAVWMRQLLKEQTKAAAWFALAFIVSSVVSVNTARFIQHAYAYTPQDVYAQNYASVFGWLNANTHVDDTVFADDNLSSLIPVYTADNVYSSQYGILFFMPDEEAQTRYVLNHFWDEYTPQYVIDHQRGIFGAYFVDKYAHDESENKLRSLLHMPALSAEQIPEQNIADFIARARSIQANDFETQLKQYRIDYLIWDTNKEPRWQLRRYGSLKEVYDSRGIIIYKVI